MNTPGRAAFLDDYDVPRGTVGAFDTYAAMLAEWQARMNLVGPSTLAALWERHFADSAQLLGLAATGSNWLDIGAGAGFPGMVVALIDPSARVTLVESTAKKCRFLEAVADANSLTDRVSIANRRVEALPTAHFDVITARACASLTQLFDWGMRFADARTRWLLPKGARYAAEIEAARESFVFDAELVASRTDPAARIVVASRVKRR